MNKSEFKKLIKEAILELVSEGAIEMAAPSLKSPTTSHTALRKTNDQVANMIRANARQLEEKKSGGHDSALLNLLADTVQTTYSKQVEVEKFGQTLEEKQNFESLFPNELIEQFNKMFDK